MDTAAPSQAERVVHAVRRRSTPKIWGAHIVGVIVCLALFGLGFGVSAIAMPAILLDRYGANGYATIAGILSTPVAIAEAVAPLAGAMLADSAGYRALVLFVAAVTLAAATSLAFAQRIPAPRDRGRGGGGRRPLG